MINTLTRSIFPAAVLSLILMAAPFGVARCLAQQQQQADGQQGAKPPDPITILNPTPEQRARIRAIREQNRDERAAINQRLREANRALEETLDSDNPNEAVVEQRLSELSAAQADQMRMRVLTEVRIRQVLTPEQQKLLRTLRQEAKRLRQSDNLNSRQTDRPRALMNQRNGLAPLLRRQGANQPKQPR